MLVQVAEMQNGSEASRLFGEQKYMVQDALRLPASAEVAGSRQPGSPLPLERIDWLPLCPGKLVVCSRTEESSLDTEYCPSSLSACSGVAILHENVYM